MRKARLLVVFVASCLASCAHTTRQVPPGGDAARVVGGASMPKRDSTPRQKAGRSAHAILASVDARPEYFNPARREVAEIEFILLQDAYVSVTVRDPEGAEITSITTRQHFEKGKTILKWDGKDKAGQVVPDEAYYPVVQAETGDGMVEVLDPLVNSGGISRDITVAHYSPESQTLTYSMPELGRVQIRVGLASGPLLYNLVDWKPRPTGEVTEYWSGRDKDGVMDVANDPRLKIVITYFTLPDDSFIAYGNAALSYREYKAKGDAIKPVQRGEQKETPSRDNLSPHFAQSRETDYEPQIVVSLPKSETRDGVPVVKGKTIVRLDLREEDKAHFAQMQYEIGMFVDGRYYAEDEVGYTPYNWVWDSSDVEPGERVLTINVSSFKDQIGVKSLKVLVER